MDYNRLAELLFPNITESIEDLEKRFPKRNLPEGAEVTRFAPSPTGYMHVGGLYATLISSRLAKQTGGVFYLRIEDTDKKREVDNGFEKIIQSLERFNIFFDEGPFEDARNNPTYAPYRQSERKDIYQACVKELVRKGRAYPCFCKEEELEQIKQEQEEKKENIGYYGPYAKCRSLTYEEIEEKIRNHEEYVVRLKSLGDPEKKLVFHDLVRGDIEMPENFQDVILLKRDGIPTYHFAHAVDDHFMRTTKVVRGDEWLSSWPIHRELFQTSGFAEPEYIHIAPISKMDGSSKRKLSKRKDPEAAVDYYCEKGIPVDAVTEYLLTIANSNYEEWRIANPEVSNDAFELSLKKMSNSGALFDMAKLLDISKEVISKKTIDECYEEIKAWSEEFDRDFYAVVVADGEKFKQTIDLWKFTNGKVRKDVGMWSEVYPMYEYLYQANWRAQVNEEFFSKYGKDNMKLVLETYAREFAMTNDKDQWFSDVKVIAEKIGYTGDRKAYKANPEGYKGLVADFCAIVRIAVTGKENSPDLFSIFCILGESEIKRRLQGYLCQNG